MTKKRDSHAEMARARQSDGISVIFDQNSPASRCSRSSRSCSSDRSSDPGHHRRRASHRGRAGHRGRYRSSSSSSSSSSSRSSSRPRSRSHPRCHRRSSRCRCDNHHRNGRGRYQRSPLRRHRASSRSRSPLPSLSRYSRHRSRSRSPGRWSRYREAARRFGSRSPSKTNRSRSRSSGHSVSLSLNDKRELLKAAKQNALKILGVEKVEIPECVKPILSVESVESKRVSPEPGTRVRQHHEKTPSQSSEEEPEMSSPKMSPNRKTITFSINNLVVKPAMAAPSCAKVTPRVDIYESRKPYGHWVPVKAGKTSKARKHNVSH